MALHDDELTIDIDLVAELLTQQMPQWSGLPLHRLRTSGTVNVTFRLGDDMVVRLPRTREFGDGPQHEARCLPVFVGEVPLDVPAFLALGTPTDSYPSHWSVLRWIEGTNADQSTLRDLNAAATALGEFVAALRQISTVGAPEGGSYRASGLARVDEGLRHWASGLPDDIDRAGVLRVWEQCLAVGEWGGPAMWLHSDLRGDNLIASGGDLVGVIDWEGCTVGDPSADHLSAWWLFDGDSRDTFRSASNASDADWIRAKGWALFMAVAAIPYYAESNPTFAAQARTALSEIMADE
ncbi:MAG: aminoglycoside phosphotransferase family protein [bacterium]|nr:aminoglycoside phosphotransferase family protein [bacterium]